MSITLMYDTGRSDLQVYCITTSTISPFLFQKVQGHACNNRSRDQLSVNTVANIRYAVKPPVSGPRGSPPRRGPGTSTLWKTIYCMQCLSYDMCSSMLSLKHFP